MLGKGCKALQIARSGAGCTLSDGYSIDQAAYYSGGFLVGLSAFSTYQAIGDTSFLNIARCTAQRLDGLVPTSGVVPILTVKGVVDTTASVIPMTTQVNVLAMCSELALFDTSFVPLVRKLAHGVLGGLDEHTGLLCVELPLRSNVPRTAETSLGAVGAFGAQALARASFVTGDTLFRSTSEKILSEIWNRRNKKNDMIGETWDLVTDSAGKVAYPGRMFRFDDMGGAYLRALMTALDVHPSHELQEILVQYERGLIDAIWDTRIASDGGFRYLTDPKGEEQAAEVETMYGLFIATLLRTLPYIPDAELRRSVIDRCRIHANGVFLTEYGLKHFMIPHNLAEGGGYNNELNDSQLGYAVLQYPLGMCALAHVTDEPSYAKATKAVIDTLLVRHRLADAEGVPPGYASMIETQPPFGRETSYYSSNWCREFLFLPAYLLFASIEPSRSVQVDWGNGTIPNVYGLCNSPPFWDLHKVNYDRSAKRLTITTSTGSGLGLIRLDELGHESIARVIKDGADGRAYEGNTLACEAGAHRYEVFFK